MAAVADNVEGAAGGGGGAATVVTDGPFTEIAGGGGGAGGDGAGNPTVSPAVLNPPGYAGGSGNQPGNGGPGKDGLDGPGGAAGNSGSHTGANGATEPPMTPALTAAAAGAVEGAGDPEEAREKPGSVIRWIRGRVRSAVRGAAGAGVATRWGESTDRDPRRGHLLERVGHRQLDGLGLKIQPGPHPRGLYQPSISSNTGPVTMPGKGTRVGP